MRELIQTLEGFENVLSQSAPKIASRLQLGLSAAEIEAKIASFSWEFPQDAFELYQQHNGLSGKPGKLNLAEKFIRIKGKWHGELAGRENEAHLQLGNRLVIVKFLPLDYALAGNRHLKLGRCPIDLLPFAILSDSNTTIYCMMRLDPDQPNIYCANGTKLPPFRVTESFLSTQPQFSQLSDLIEFLTRCFQEGIQPVSAIQESSRDKADCQLNLATVDRLYQLQKSHIAN